MKSCPGAGRELLWSCSGREVTLVVPLYPFFGYQKKKTCKWYSCMSLLKFKKKKKKFSATPN